MRRAVSGRACKPERHQLLFLPPVALLVLFQVWLPVPCVQSTVELPENVNRPEQHPMAACSQCFPWGWNAGLRMPQWLQGTHSQLLESSEGSGCIFMDRACECLGIRPCELCRAVCAPLGGKVEPLTAWRPRWYCLAMGHVPAEMEKDSNLMEELRIVVSSVCWIINYPKGWLGFWHVESHKPLRVERKENGCCKESCGKQTAFLDCLLSYWCIYFRFSWISINPIYQELLSIKLDA